MRQILPDEKGEIRVAWGYSPEAEWGALPVWQADIPAGGSLRTAEYAWLYGSAAGLPVLAVNHQGDVVWQGEGDVYGKVTPAANNRIVVNRRLAGQYFDAETGLHHNGFRDYDPATGRYLQEDPVGIAGGLNGYLYAAGNPLRYSDPHGLWVAPLLRGAAVLLLPRLTELLPEDKCHWWKSPRFYGELAAAMFGGGKGSKAGRAGKGTSNGAPQLPNGKGVDGKGSPLPVPPDVGANGRVPTVLQSGGNTLTKNTANELNKHFGEKLTPREWGRALEALKADAGKLPNNFHGKILKNGDYIGKKGERIGNIRDYLP